MDLTKATTNVARRMDERSPTPFRQLYPLTTEAGFIEVVAITLVIMVENLTTHKATAGAIDCVVILLQFFLIKCSTEICYHFLSFSTH